MATVRDMISSAHRLLGLVSSGNVLPEAVYQDNLITFQQMVDSWNTERLTVFSTVDQTRTWPVNERVQTFGPTGNIVADRPVMFDDSTYFRDPTTNISYGIKMLNELQYNNIAVKTVTSTFPQVMWVNMTHPDITIHVYPVPSRALEFHFISVRPLVSPAELTTELALPPGYMRALIYNLAMEFAPEFNLEPTPQVQRIAMTSKRNIKRINNPDDIMAMPYSLMARRNRFNIFAGNY